MFGAREQSEGAGWSLMLGLERAEGGTGLYLELKFTTFLFEGAFEGILRKNLKAGVKHGPLALRWLPLDWSHPAHLTWVH